MEKNNWQDTENGMKRMDYFLNSVLPHLQLFSLLKSQAREPAPPPAPPAEGELVGRGRQKGAPGPFSAEGTVEHKVMTYMFLMSIDVFYSLLLKVCVEMQLKMWIDRKALTMATTAVHGNWVFQNRR